MPISTTCPGCQARFDLPDDLAGEEVRCQKCELQFTVPEPVAEPAPAELAEPAPAQAPEPAAAKPKKRPAAKEGWVGTLVSLVMLLSFAATLSCIGALAVTWIVTHLSPPARAVAVPPLHLDQNVKELPKLMPK